MMQLLDDGVPALLLQLRIWHLERLLAQLDAAQHLQLADEFRKQELAVVPDLQPYNRRTTP